MKDVVSGAGWSLAAISSRAVVSTVTLAILARLLSPYEFGVFGAAAAVLAIAAVVGELGMPAAVIHTAQLSNAHLRAAALLLGCSTAVAVLVTSALGPGLARVLDLPPLALMLPVLSIVLLTDASGAIARAVLCRSMRFRPLAVADLSGLVIAYPVVAITAAAWGLGYWSLVLAHLSQSLVRAVLTRRMAALAPEREAITRAAAGQMLRYGVGTSLAQLGNAAALHGDNLVVAGLLGPRALGLYGRAYQVLSVPAMLWGQVLQGVLFPALSRIRDDTDRLRAVFFRSNAVVAYATIPFSLLTFVLAPEIVLVLLGSTWAGVIAPLQILVIGTYFRVAYKTCDALTQATGAVYPRAAIQAGYAGAITGGAALGSRWGLTGATAFVVGAILLNFLAMCRLASRETGTSWVRVLETGVRPLLLAVIGACVAWVLVDVMRQIEAPPIARATVAGAGWLCAVACAVAWIPALREDETLIWLRRFTTRRTD